MNNHMQRHETTNGTEELPEPETYTKAQLLADLEAKAKADQEKARLNQEEAQKEQLRAGWVASGGDPGKFETEWPSLRDELHRQNTREYDQAVRNQAAQQIRRAF